MLMKIIKPTSPEEDGNFYIEFMHQFEENSLLWIFFIYFLLKVCRFICKPLNEFMG
jgi:hypothetical protein